ncbi:multicopper oxidase family protein [Nannocystaceae bacterium ST9]
MLRAHPLWFVCSALPLLACRGPSADDEGDDEGGEGCFVLADGSCVQETFANPPVLEPNEDGVHELALAATEVTIDGQRHCVRSYNGAFVAPTIETPANEGTPRSIRVNLANRMLLHDYRSLEGDACECTNSQGESCVPEHVHDRCKPVDDDCTCTNDEGEVCEHMFDFNVTNLHAHGSHVRPDWARGGEACESTSADGVTYACRDCDEAICDGEGDDACFHGDNVLNAVHPGAGAQYRWDIDEDGTHHTGLQWYHPHIHGTTAIQVASGAAGAWIVRGPLDELPGIADARERVIVFSTPSIANDKGFAPLADDQECSDSTLTFNDFSVLGSTTAPQMNVINGVRRPRMITPPGQVERWRIVHTGFLDEVFLGLFRGEDSDCSSFSTASEDTIQLTQIGRDGLILPETFADDYVFMSPGYRVEAMLGGEGRLAQGDTWCLVAARFLQDPEGGGFPDQPVAPQDPPSRSDIFTRFDTDGDVVAILNVSESAGPATTTTLPDYAAIAALAPPVEFEGVDVEQACADAVAAEDPATIDQAAVLQVGFFTADEPDPCDCPNYNVNCHNFEQTDRTKRPFDRDLPLDAVEHWRVEASFDGHPFHIHINPYVVCPKGDDIFDPLPFPHWRDTYLVNLDREVDLITQNRAFTGSFVFHCHKLTHEDHGMMELIRVCDPAEDPTCGDNGWRECSPDDLECVQALAATDCALSGSTLQAAACIAALGSPLGVCGPNACSGDADCGGPTPNCVDNVCSP